MGKAKQAERPRASTAAGPEDGKPKAPATRKRPPLQYGAIPYRRNGDGNLEVMLITTRTSKTWIVPKGRPIKGKTPAESAAQEAFEEAGVTGRTSKRPLGRFESRGSPEGRRGDGRCDVVVFALRVRKQAAAWDERSQRETRWCTPAAAMTLARDEGLAELIGTLAATKSRSGATDDRRRKTNGADGTGKGVTYRSGTGAGTEET